MELSEANRLKRLWGGKPCPHPDLERETFNGVKTGDRVCTTCGESFSPEEIEQRRNADG